MAVNGDRLRIWHKQIVHFHTSSRFAHSIFGSVDYDGALRVGQEFVQIGQQPTPRFLRLRTRAAQALTAKQLRRAVTLVTGCCGFGGAVTLVHRFCGGVEGWADGGKIEHVYITRLFGVDAICAVVVATCGRCGLRVRRRA